MWIHTDTAFVSIVAHSDRPGDLLVRARTRRDLERSECRSLRSLLTLTLITYGGR